MKLIGSQENTIGPYDGASGTMVASTSLMEESMLPARQTKREPGFPAIPTPELSDQIKDWVCVAGFVATAVAVTMVSFILL